MYTKLRVLLSALLVFGVAACDVSTPSERSTVASAPPVSFEHLESVVRLAAAAASPGQHPSPGAGTLTQLPDGTYQFTPPPHAAQSARLQASSSPRLITLDERGRVTRIRRDPDDKTIRALESFGKGWAGDFDSILPKESMPEMKIAALVEFKRPVKEQRLGRLNFAENALPVFISGARPSGLPIYWSGEEGCPEVAGQGTCREYSTVQQFRAWAARLTPADDVTLEGFGLSVADIRTAADEGLIYGTLIENASPDFLRDLREHPNVGGVWITDMQPCREQRTCP
ncbi:hypothetical protein [Nonomuraea sp. C10]|uniref:hypothetical protein n=1 Tax=Nonomuraea sp. C10 TaxID=2600577 RepID=UPI0011CE1B60|nr:hypothetical protein [Nonomuraea sp. C10]TXK42855.1 hypothetical protein FR742_27685 [Nonomuraea sp. C10]